MEMPAMMGKAKVQQRLIDNLEDEFKKVSYFHFCFLILPSFFVTYYLLNYYHLAKQVQREFHLPAGDFPNIDHFREVLSSYSIDKFDKLKPKMIQAVDDMLGYEIPELLKKFRNPYD